MIKTNKKRLPYAIFRQAVMIIATFCFLAPFVIVFMVSLKTGSDVYSTTIFPKKATLDNYAYVFSSTSILKSFSNTIFYVALPLLVGVLTSSMASYALGRLKFKGSEIIFSVLFATVLITGIITLVPSYVMFANFYHWVGTPLPLIVPGMFGGVMVMFYLRQYMLGLPYELEEAAFIDGLNRGGIFFKIILPLCKPAIIAQLVLSFTGFYNDLMTPLMYINTKPELWTVQLVINSLNSEYGALQERLLAACIIALLPTFVLFAVAQRSFIDGIAVSGNKE